MALEYRLVLAGTTTAAAISGRAFPADAERPSGDGPLLTADLKERLGFTVAARAGRNAFVDVETDQGQWTWEPGEYVAMTFRMDKFADPGWNVMNMFAAVRRVLETGQEDAVLVLNSDVLLLSRLGGVLTKHRRDRWWNHYPEADEALAG